MSKTSTNTTTQTIIVFVNYTQEQLNLDLKDNMIYCSGEEFKALSGLDSKQMLNHGFNLYNKFYKIEMSEVEITDLVNKFINYLEENRNLETGEGDNFTDYYNNKFTNYIEANNIKPFLKMKLSSYLFYSFTECLIQNKDKNYLIFFRF